MMTNPIIPFYKQADRTLVRSVGCCVYDAENKEYIDFESGDWAANLGHSHPAINRLIKEQVDKMIHDGLRFRNIESEQLSIKLLEKLGLNDGQCAFLNSGSEAVNLGITLARRLTGRIKVLKMDCSYLSAFGYGQMADTNTDLISIPMDQTEAISQLNFEEIAVFVLEPGNAWGFIRYPGSEFVRAIADGVSKHGGLLMANEVTTGFGRTGKWFGFQYYDYNPDIISVGKALGNGYPVSGVAVSAKVAALFSNNPFRYAQSHQNDALGCAVGLEVIRTMEKEDLINQSFEKGLYFKEELIRLQAKHNSDITDIRARGLMIALEMNAPDRAEDLYNRLIDKGFLVGLKEKTIRFMPPLIIEKIHIDQLVGVIDEVLSKSL